MRPASPLSFPPSGFDFEEWTVGGQTYERLTIPDYINGHTAAAGYPLLPLKGILVDLPVDKSARLTVLGDRQPDPQRLPGVPGAHPRGDSRTVRSGRSSSTIRAPITTMRSTRTGDRRAWRSNYLYRDKLKQKADVLPASLSTRSPASWSCTSASGSESILSIPIAQASRS